MTFITSHEPAVSSLPPSSVWAIRDYFMLAELPGISLYDQTRARGLWQADLVLALLRMGERDGVEALMGQPIEVCPPCLSRMNEVPAAPKPGPGNERIVLLVRNPRLPTSVAWHRWREIRSGRTTVREYLARGGPRRDLRYMISRGWARLEAAPPVGRWMPFPRLPATLPDVPATQVHLATASSVGVH